MAPRFVCHRGGAALWPENSLLAFRSAIAMGATLLELDVHGTADGNVAVIHDPTLDRTTTGCGPVAARTAAELRELRLRAGSGELTQEWVPTLGEVLALAAPARVALLVEVKTPGPAVVYRNDGGAITATPGPRYPGVEKRIVDELRRAGMDSHATVMAFNPAVVAAVRSLCPDMPTALLVDSHHVEGAGGDPGEAVGWAVRARATFLGIHHSLVDGTLVDAARAAGLGLGVFTVNDEDDMRRLAALGVDVIISDRADVVTRLQREGLA